MNWLTPDPQRLGTRHVQIFVPSLDREGNPIPEGHRVWVERTLTTMGRLLAGRPHFRHRAARGAMTSAAARSS